jgi:hypothetical protein
MELDRLRPSTRCRLLALAFDRLALTPEPTTSLLQPPVLT